MPARHGSESDGDAAAAPSSLARALQAISPSFGDWITPKPANPYFCPLPRDLVNEHVPGSGSGIERCLYTLARERDLPNTSTGGIENRVSNSCCCDGRSCLSRAHGAPVRPVDQDGIDFWDVGAKEQQRISYPVN